MSSKARDPAAESLAGEREQRQRLLGARETDEGGRSRPRIGEQPQRSGGDDSERAFRADEQVFDVVAGVVLAQLAQRVDDPPVGQDRLDAGHEVARIAVGDHRHAAGVGRHVAADGAGSFRGERQRKQPVGGERGGLRLGQRHARLADHHVRVRVDLADAFSRWVERMIWSPLSSGVWPPTRPVLPPCGTIPIRAVVAERRDRRDLLRRAGPHERQRLAPIEPARLDQARRR